MTRSTDDSGDRPDDLKKPIWSIKDVARYVGLKPRNTLYRWRTDDEEEEDQDYDYGDT